MQGHSGGGDGAEVIYALRNNDTLAKLITNEIARSGQNVRKYYQRRLPSDSSKDYYYLLRDTPNNETLIVEYGFADSTGDDVSILKNNWQNLAEAVVRALATYIGVPYEGGTIGEEFYTVKSGDTIFMGNNEYQYCYLRHFKEKCLFIWYNYMEIKGFIGGFIMVITDLKDKLDNEFQKHYNIILINGTWGIGKTYYLKEYLKSRKYIYVSLFGIDKLEGIKSAIYYELNKIGASINEFINNNSNRDIGISFLTIPIPNVSSDIEKKIRKKLKKESLILVIDDLERKSDNINVKELLGFIESMSEIENIKIIIVANEEQIKEKEVYDSFKEKVINKTYNITRYSEDAVKIISKQLLDDNPIENIISNDDFYNSINNILSNHKIKNLRTLRKSILFTKIFLEKFDNKILKNNDKLELIRICFAVVIEDCDNLYYKLEKDTSLEECILKHYFNDTFINGKLGIIRPIINIYNDENTEVNYKKALDYYIGKYSVTTSEKDIFYCSEQEVEQRLNNFVDNNIKKINNKIDINIWFKEFNNLYPWAKKINKSNLFDKNEIISAIEKYVEKINVNNNLYNLIDKTMPFHISHDDIKEYYKIVKIKISQFYFNKLIEKIIYSIKLKNYDTDLMRDLFETLDNSYLIEDSVRKNIIKKIEENNFFIPNINGDITENQWSWCHVI